MAFINKIKNIFGLSDSDYETEINAEDQALDATVTPLSQRRGYDHSPSRNNYYSENSSASEMTNTVADAPEMPESMPEEIFTSVVEIFNNSLPDFLKKNVNQEAQKKYIYESLDQSMKDYIARLEEIANKRCEIRWTQERNRMTKEMESVRESSRRIEESTTELRELKLSAERQKRALSERVHDLEKQVDSLQAEREQFDLENKSLVNKIRVLSTQEGDLDQLRKDNEELRAEINRLKAAAANIQSGEVSDNGASEQLAEVKTLIAEYEKENKRLSETNSSLTIDVETLKKRCDIADTMINDLNGRLSGARKEVSDLTTQLTSRAAELKEKDADITRLKSELEKAPAKAAPANDDLVDGLKSQIAELEEKQQRNATLLKQKEDDLKNAMAEVEESRESLKMFQASLEQIEQVQENREKRLAKLQAEIRSRDEEIESLKSTITQNIEQQARSEAVLRQELESLRKAGSETERTHRRKASSKPMLEIDETLDDTNWLVAGDPTDVTRKQDDDFGYREPKRQPINDDPAQLSLF